MENPFELILEKLNGIEKAIAILNTVEPIVGANHPMDIKALSTYLKMSRSSIYKMTSSNDIPHYKNGRRLYFKKSEIDEWIFSNRIKTNDDIKKEGVKYINKNRK